MRDDLVTALLSRLEAFVSGDHSQVLDDQALHEARALMEITASAPDLEAMFMVASLHRARHRALPAEPPGTDYETALSLFTLIGLQRPDLVPAEFRTVIEQREARDSDPGALAAQALDLFVGYTRNHDASMLNAAIDLFQRASDEADDAVEKAVYLGNVCSALTLRGQRMGSREDLDLAVTLGRRAADLAPSSRPVCLGYLGGALHQRFQGTRNTADADAAIAVTREAIAAVGLDDSHRWAFAGNLAGMLGARFYRSEDAEDLDAAIAAFQTALEMTPAENSARQTLQDSLGDLLRERSARGGDPADLNRATSGGRATLAAASGDPEALSNLGGRYRTRFTRYGDIRDLDESIRLSQAAVDAIQLGHPDRPRYLANLSGAVRTRYAATGNVEDLNTAVRVGQEAVDTLAEDRPERAALFTDLMIALRLRYLHTGSRDDLRAALMHGTTALNASDGKDPNVLSNLSVTARFQGEVTGRLQMIQIAVFTARKALELTPDGDPMRSSYLSNLATALSLQAQKTGDAKVTDEAIAATRAAVEATEAEDADRPGRLSNLATNLMRRFRITGEPDDLNDAISVFQAAVDASPRGTPNAAGAKHNLAWAFEERFRRDKDQESLTRALHEFRDVAESELATTRIRLSALQGHARLCMAAGQPGKALQSYRYAIEDMLPRLVWRGLDRVSQLTQLGHFPGLASDAAAAAIEQDQIEDAVRLLEQGRSVLWAHMMETRGDWAGLHERYPQLAASFNEVCRVLDINVVHFNTSDVEDGAARYSPAGLSERLRLTERHAALLAEIRALPGFERFLQVPAYAELQLVADDGPVVIINISRHRCDALVLRPGHDRVQLVKLPQLTWDEVAHRAQVFVQATDTLMPLTVNPALAIFSRQTILATTEWLWEEIVGPVLRELAMDEPVQSRDPDETTPVAGLWPRVWWCPTGPLSLLPLHAAGLHDQGIAAADRVVSSYTPTLRSLIHARARTPADDGRSPVLAVGMHHTPPHEGSKLSDLPAVPTELAVLEKRFGNHLLAIQDEEATRDKVKAALHEHPWVHFACHGTYNPADPTASSLALSDGTLSVLDIANECLDRAELAFLSACHTAHGRLDVADEAMHVAAAFQLAGYQHVIGTLWSVRDSAAPEIANAVYAALGGTPARAAIALHEAINALRAPGHSASIIRWAPYIHIGP